MHEPTSILKSDGQEPAPTEYRSERGPVKFAYASGSQPLPGYTIKRGIGIGGFGDVYYATSDAGKEVALKRIQRNLDVELRGVRQCLNLKHTNLVSLYDIRYDDQDQAWVVMEYVSGEVMQDVLERYPNGMPIDEIRHWMDGIAQGLNYLHEHGIVHRDLKPGNLFLDQGVVKIGDYGLSKFISCSRRSGQTESVGTFHYMAPEIGLGRYGKEIDIYALGILLYEMLTGHVPFEGESSQEIIMKHLTADPDLSRLPKPYRTVIAKSLAKDPIHRYSSVNELLDAFRVASGGQPQATPGPAHRQAVWQPVVAEVIQRGRTLKEAAGPREPIAFAVQNGFQSLQNWWYRSDFSRPVQLVLFTTMVIALIMNAGWMIPVGFSLAICYGVYYFVWYLVTNHHAQDTTFKGVPYVAEVVRQNPKSLEPLADESPVPVRRVARHLRPRTVTKQQVSDAVRDRLQSKTFRQRTVELTGSMLTAAIVSAVLCLIMMVVSNRSFEASVADWGPIYAWLTVTSVVGAWTVMLLSKRWESQTGDGATRRFCMMTAGMGVGAFACFLSRQLLLEPTYLLGSWDTFQATFGRDLPALYEVTGSPKMLAYVGYFGALFALPRWWINADPLRNGRFGLIATALTVVVAIVLNAVMPIPRAFMVAATMVIAVQLASPWIDHRARREVKEQMLANHEIHIA